MYHPKLYVLWASAPASVAAIISNEYEKFFIVTERESPRLRAFCPVGLRFIP
jgi:hypothetical protein